MKLSKNKLIAVFILILCFSLIFPYQAKGQGSVNEEIQEIQKQIEDYKNEIKNLEKDQEVYENKIKELQNEAKTLKNELSLLDAQASKIETEIKKNEKQIEYLQLIIKNIQFRILEKERQINEKKQSLQRSLQLLYKESKKNYLTIFITQPSLSSLVKRIYYLRTLEKNLVNHLNQYKTIKKALEEQETLKREALNEIEQTKKRIEDEKDKLLATRQVKASLLEQTRGAEWKFQSLLAEAIEQERQREKEIQELEKKARQKLAEIEKQNKTQEELEQGDIVFSWPVPNEKITCYFHDPDYPYRYIIGEHSGIDLRAPQGTPVRAAASGYVARAKDGGMGYSYVMIIHNDKFSTLYGHLSEISVKQDQYVRRGQVIGKSGGMPGTPGAGRFSTGPHLHFEVRLNGLPVNPLDYLL